MVPKYDELSVLKLFPQFKSDIEFNNIPKCESCMLGKSKRRKWRYKSSIKPNSKQKSMNQQLPRHTVSVDQLESAVPGLIEQMSGNPTHTRYRVATVYVDLFSRYVYTHFQTTTSADETLKSKKYMNYFHQSSISK